MTKKKKKENDTVIYSKGKSNHVNLLLKIYETCGMLGVHGAQVELGKLIFQGIEIVVFRDSFAYHCYRIFNLHHRPYK